MLATQPSPAKLRCGQSDMYYKVESTLVGDSRAYLQVELYDGVALGTQYVEFDNATGYEGCLKVLDGLRLKLFSDMAGTVALASGSVLETSSGETVVGAQLGLNDSDQVFLLMSGSMGFGDLIDTTRYIFENGNGNTRVIAITGHNEELYKNLQTEFKNETRLMLIGFTDKVSDYMDASDVLLTKPGGLSSTEALAKGIAIIHTAPIPGCETENTQFFTEHHLSLCAKHPEDAGRLAVALMNEPFMREQILAAQEHFRCQDSAKQIVEFVEGR